MPGSLTARDISRSHGPDVVLDRVAISVHPGSRIGVVGPNGVGKSTLLRILAGLDQPDSGTVSRIPPSLTVGYLPQELDAGPGETVSSYLARRTGVAETQAELDRLTALLAEDPSHVGAYSDALERFLALGGDDFEARSAEVAAELGLPAGRLGAPVEELSGGQATRLGLAAILLARFDVFLLDEPTNNLDFAGLERLEAFLDGLQGGAVVVSHDRAFLERAVVRVVEIEEDSRRSVEYGGGFVEYLRMREAQERQRYQAHAAFGAQRERLEDQVRRQKRWAAAGVRRARKDPDDPDKSIRFARISGSEKMATRAKTTERKLERLEKVDKPWEGWQLRLSLQPSARSGDLVVRLTSAVVERGEFRLGPLDLEVGWQDRVAVLGPNGAGKSTLLGAIQGSLPLAAGHRQVGPGVVMGDLDQRRRTLAGEDSLLGRFRAASGMVVEEARSLLAKFDLGASDVTRPADSLSAGERTRAALALLMALQVNCLILDEPTNHLDLPAIEQLESALADFDGTLLLVTHDRRLLENVHVTRQIELGSP